MGTERAGEQPTEEPTLAPTEPMDLRELEEADAESAKRPSLSALGRLGIVVAVLAVAAGGIWFTVRVSTPAVSPTTTGITALGIPEPDVQPGSAAPVDARVAGGVPPTTTRPAAQQPAQPTQRPADLLSVWAERVAEVTGIPARALIAYGNAELQLRASEPACRISWATLAGIGRIESDHGQYGGAVLRSDGYPSRPIIGVPLDGSPGVREMPDTDHGRFDGDADFDHAVGPMQFIPATWAKWGGGYDPEQIDAAALAAAKYLCAGGRDMSGAQGWWSGVLSYNNSVDYARKVFGLADSYAKAAQVVQVS